MEVVVKNWPDLLMIGMMAIAIGVLGVMLKVQNKQKLETLKQYKEGDTIHYRWGKTLESGRVTKVTEEHIEVLNGKQTHIVYTDLIIH